MSSRLNDTLRRARADGEQHLDALEAAYTTLLRAAGRAAAGAFRAQALVAAVNPWEPPPGDLVDGGALERDAAARLEPIHKRILRAVTPAGDLGIDWSIRNPTSQALLATVAARLGDLGDAIRQQVADEIRNGYQNGSSVAATAKAITAKVDSVAPARAAALARTDLNALANGGSLMLASQVDGVTTKTWLATDDERTRETHAEADGQTVPIDQPFTVGGEQAQYPGDPDLSDEESFNCRCTVTYGDNTTASAATHEGGDEMGGITIPNHDPDSGLEISADVAASTADPFDGLDEDALLDLAARATARAGEIRSLSAFLTEIELTAAADGGPTAWRATLLVEDEVTEDGRLLMPDSTSWRQLPLTLGLMLETPHSYETDAPACGRIDMIWRAGNAIQASGVFSDASDDPELAATGRQAVAAITDRIVRGISVDLAVLDGDTLFIPDRDDYDEAGEDELPPEVGEELAPVVDGEQSEVVVVDDPAGRYVWCVREGVIGSACVVPFPAIAQATIEVVTAAAGFQVARSTRSLFCDCEALEAAVAPLRPPAEWFENPKLDGPTPLTVTDDGRVYGHIALWTACHTGYQGRCVPPPRSRTSYSHFHVGELETDDGARVPVGKITLKAGHAGTQGVTAAQARAHYDNTATVAAFVRAGEDRFGPWVAGALRSDLSMEERRDLMANPPSGDWRNNEMIAVHAVPTPGFPVLRAAALDEGGEERETALILTSPLQTQELIGGPRSSALSYLKPGRRAAA